MLAPAFFDSFLADALPPLTKAEWGDSLIVGLVLLAVAAVVAIFIKNIRRDPPIEQEIDQKIAIATTNLELRINDKLNDLKRQIEKQVDSTAQLQRTLEAGFRDVQRSIGRVEGKCLNCLSDGKGHQE